MMEQNFTYGITKFLPWWNDYVSGFRFLKLRKAGY